VIRKNVKRFSEKITRKRELKRDNFSIEPHAL